MYNKGVSNTVSNFISVSSYPGVILLGFVLYSMFCNIGFPIFIAAYAAVIICAALVTLHELILPFRHEWKPRVDDLKNDAWFMILVQFALPYLLSITVVVLLSQIIKSNGYAIENIWPHDLPVALQVCLMLVLAEFPRYWLHRAFHNLAPMWRFHAVHHSPHRLYWLNVGRFHPIEKAVQYVFDALPFALMGLSTEVLGAYFIFYAINGFYQHSNCLVLLGPLNYIVSGPELHRWHHSVNIKESNNNYGNNLIIWDVIFGTRFLPQNRLVGDLGLLNRNYPKSLIAQMKTPFIKGIDKAQS
ncbi:MAG: sterol desaturase family protein [Desulfobulbia bacterium]